MRNRQILSREAFRDRDETLRLLGFKSYSAYSRSKLWQIIRERAFEINGRLCKRCGGEATQVHHASYTREVMTGEDVRALMPLCGGCHGGASTLKRGERNARADCRHWASLGETNERLAKRLRSGPITKAEEREKRRQHWCPCGKRRKRNHSLCGYCRKLKDGRALWDGWKFRLAR